MRTQLTQEAIRLTSDFLESIFKGDTGPVLAVSDTGISWIGSGEGQFHVGYDSFREAVLNLVPVISPATLSDRNFLIAQNYGNFCTVLGSYYVTRECASESDISGWHRCVAVWRADRGKLVLVHLSSIAPVQIIHETARDTGKPMPDGACMNGCPSKNLEAMLRRRLIITDTDKSLHFIREDDILYFESDDKYTQVFLLDYSIRTRMQLKEFLPMLSSAFLKVSRFNIVNMNMVSGLREQDLVLVDGRSLPIPARQLTDVKRQLMEYFSCQ